MHPEKPMQKRRWFWGAPLRQLVSILRTMFGSLSKIASAIPSASNPALHGVILLCIRDKALEKGRFLLVRRGFLCTKMCRRGIVWLCM